MPERLEKLIDLGREPLYADVETRPRRSAGSPPRCRCTSRRFGSTQVASAGLGDAAEPAGRTARHPDGHRRERGPRRTATDALGDDTGRSLLGRIRALRRRGCADGYGGVVVQQSTEDADAEVWNLVYSDPAPGRCSNRGRLAFELKVGQGAKPGLGGMTVLDRAAAARARRPVRHGRGLRHGQRRRCCACASPGTFTEEILRQQIRLMRNNFPRARIWVKLHPGRDVGRAAAVAWDGRRGRGDRGRRRGRHRLGAHRSSSTRSGCRSASACGGSAEGPRALPAGQRPDLGGRPGGQGPGARRPGRRARPGRAARRRRGPGRRAGPARRCLALEIRLLVSALGKYHVRALGPEDLWPALGLAERAAQTVSRRHPR